MFKKFFLTSIFAFVFSLNIQAQYNPYLIEAIHNSNVEEVHSFLENHLAISQQEKNLLHHLAQEKVIVRRKIVEKKYHGLTGSIDCMMHDFNLIKPSELFATGIMAFCGGIIAAAKLLKDGNHEAANVTGMISGALAGLCGGLGIQLAFLNAIAKKHVDAVKIENLIANIPVVATV